jgi:ABC-type proline/glycine betaine transport system substrate-binding protein
MSDLMGYLADDTVSEAEGAKMWKDKNQELVEGWFE